MGKRFGWRRHGVSALAMVVAGAVAAPPLMAQTQAPPTPPTREEIQRGVVDQSLRGEAQDLSVEGGPERSPCALANPEFSDIRFTLRAVEFANLKEYPREALNPTYSQYLGQEVPVAVICDIRDRAATALRDAGYLAAVQVPAQRIEDGTVRLEVLMARIAAVQVRGEAGPHERVLSRYINKIGDQPVFNIHDVERYLLLARDVPGLDVRLALRPTEGAPGDVVAEFSVVRTPFFAELNVQNFGTRAVGRFGAQARARVNGLTGLGDETSFSFFTTVDLDEQQVLQFGHDFTVGGEGLTFSGDFTYSWTEPGLGGGLDISSDTLVASFAAGYPLIRSQSRNLRATLGFDYVDQTVDFSNVRLTEDTLSILYARLDGSMISEDSVSGRDGYTAAEPHWAIAGGIELRQGIDLFGATDGCGPNLVNCQGAGVVTPSRLEGDATAFVLRAYAQFDWRPSPDWTLSFAPRAQIASDPLLTYEEISGGNYTDGRGFDPGTVIGDSGFGFRTEVRYGSIQPRARDAFAVQPFVFFDALWVDNKDTAFDGFNPQRLYSSGGGVRARFGSGAQLEALVAVPLNSPGFATETPDPRFLISLTMQLAPWNFN